MPLCDRDMIFLGCHGQGWPGNASTSVVLIRVRIRTAISPDQTMADAQRTSSAGQAHGRMGAWAHIVMEQPPSSNYPLNNLHSSSNVIKRGGPPRTVWWGTQNFVLLLFSSIVVQSSPVMAMLALTDP